MKTENEVIIFTDGASKGNPGPGGWAAIVVMSEKVIELGGREEYTTNNKMEMTAAIEALRFLSKNKEYQEKKNLSTVTVYVDSAYVVNGITKWVKGWQKKGWINTQKEEVQNRDLWEALIDAVDDKKITWKIISGHVGIAGNERVDEIATGFAEGSTPKLFSGNLSEYKKSVDILNIAHDTGLKANKKSKSSHSRAQAYSYVSMVKGVIQTHKTWAECEKGVKGVAGARFKKATSAAMEQEIITEFKK